MAVEVFERQDAQGTNLLQPESEDDKTENTYSEMPDVSEMDKTGQSKDPSEI